MPTGWSCQQPDDPPNGKRYYEWRHQPEISRQLWETVPKGWWVWMRHFCEVRKHCVSWSICAHILLTYCCLYIIFNLKKKKRCDRVVFCYRDRYFRSHRPAVLLLASSQFGTCTLISSEGLRPADVTFLLCCQKHSTRKLRVNSWEIHLKHKGWMGRADEFYPYVMWHVTSLTSLCVFRGLYCPILCATCIVRDGF